MEFGFDLWQIFKAEDDRICILDGLTKSSLSHKPIYMANNHTSMQYDVINKMGTASAQAQQLKQIITTADRFFGSPQRLYLKIEGKKCLGILKVGERNLFYHDGMSIKEIKPLCVLDFYVHESVQRGGIGKELFEKMLAKENKEASQLAYDRPSLKLLGFLRKHYNLVHFIAQNNNFVIFSEYFRGKQPIQPQAEQRQFQNAGRQVLAQTPQVRSTSTMGHTTPYATYNEVTIKHTEKELEQLNRRLQQIQQPYTSFKPTNLPLRAPWATQTPEEMKVQPRQRQPYKTGFY